MKVFYLTPPTPLARYVMKSTPAVFKRFMVLIICLILLFYVADFDTAVAFVLVEDNIIVDATLESAVSP